MAAYRWINPNPRQIHRFEADKCLTPMYGSALTFANREPRTANREPRTANPGMWNQTAASGTITSQFNFVSINTSRRHIHTISLPLALTPVWGACISFRLCDADIPCFVPFYDTVRPFGWRKKKAR